MSIAQLIRSFNVQIPPSYLTPIILENPNVHGTAEHDWFGFEVAISGNVALVISISESDASGLNSGKAYIFNATTGSLLRTINNPNTYGTSADDRFGSSASMDGNYISVGAHREDDAGGTDSGKAYIFNATTGSLLRTINNPNTYGTSADDRFGTSVAISGNRIIVSAPSEDDAGGSYAGKAYIFDATTGSLLHTLNNPNAYGTSASDNFGFSVAISGNYAIVGAPYEDDAAGETSGKVYIFNATTGSLLRTLNNPNAHGTSADDQFGYSVAISGNYVVIGSRFESESGGTNSGKAYIFDVTTGSLLHTLHNPNAYGTPTDDWFGDYVAISGNYVVISAHQEDSAASSSSGIAYVYHASTGQLLHVLAPVPYGLNGFGSSGWSVGISGKNIIVGAYSTSTSLGQGSGRAYLYKIP